MVLGVFLMVVLWALVSGVAWLVGVMCGAGLPAWFGLLWLP